LIESTRKLQCFEKFLKVRINFVWCRNLQYVTQNLAKVTTLVNCIDSKAAAMFDMLKKKKEDEYIKKVEREMGHAIGKEIVIPCILKRGGLLMSYGPLTKLEHCYFYMVEDYFAIVKRVGELDDFPPKSRFYHGKRYVGVENFHFAYSEISSICLTVVPQLISIQINKLSKPIMLFSGFIQHLVNELALRKRVGTIPVFCQPGARKFQYADLEIKKIPIPPPGRVARIAEEVTIKPYIPPPAGPDMSIEEVKRDVAKHVQEEGIDHIQELVVILTQDQQLLKQELVRQNSQLEAINERTNSSLEGFNRQTHKINNKIL